MKFSKKTEPEEGGVLINGVSGTDEVTTEATEPKVKKAKSDPSTFEYDSPYRPTPLMVPNYLAHRRAMKASKNKAVRTIVWGLLIVAIVSLGAFGFRYISTVQLNEAKTDQAIATDELKKYAGLSSFFDGLDLREKQVQERLTSEVNYAKVVGAINDALPGGATITALQTRFGQSCPGPNPFETEESIGCVDFTISVTDEAQLQTFLARANQQGADEVVSFIVNSSTRDDNGEGITANGTANFTPKVFTYRFGEEPADATAQEEAAAPAAPIEETS